MKKIIGMLALVLVLTLMVPTLSLAAPKGITVDNFIAWFEVLDSSGAFATKTYDNRTVFMGYHGDTGMVAGFSFQGDDIVECAWHYGEDNLITVYFLSAISEESAISDKLTAVAKITDTMKGDVSLVLRDSFSKSLKIANYYPDAFSSDEIGILWFWLNSDSTLSTKLDAFTLIPTDDYPLTEAVLQYYVKNPDA